MVTKQDFLDYVEFMEKGLPPHTDLKYPAALGRRTWTVLHGLADHYGCDTCKAPFQILVSGIHDMVNVKLGKGVYDMKRFEKFVEMVNSTASKVLKNHPIFSQDTAVPLEEKDGQAFVGDEEFTKLLPVTAENVLKSVDHYTGEYGAPASISDIQFLLTIPHGSATDKAIDRSLAKAPPEKVKIAVAALERGGFVERTGEGGYIVTDSGRKQLGIPNDLYSREGKNNLNMKSSTEVGLIVGGDLAAKGTEFLASWADTTYGLATQPIHNRISTWLPVAGAVIIAAAYKLKYLKKEGRQLAATVYGAHLLGQAIDVAQEATAPGAVLGIVPVNRGFIPRFQPGLTPAPTPGYISGQIGGIGQGRSIF